MQTSSATTSTALIKRHSHSSYAALFAVAQAALTLTLLGLWNITSSSFCFFLSFFLSFFLALKQPHTQSPHHKDNTKTPTQTHTHTHTREIRPKEQRDTRTPITPIVAYRPRLSLSCLRSFSSVQSFSLFIVRSLSFVDLLLTVHTFFLLLFFFVKKFSKMSTQERHRLGLSLAVLVMLNLK